MEIKVLCIAFLLLFSIVISLVFKARAHNRKISNLPKDQVLSPQEERKVVSQILNKRNDPIKSRLWGKIFKSFEKWQATRKVIERGALLYMPEVTLNGSDKNPTEQYGIDVSDITPYLSRKGRVGGYELFFKNAFTPPFKVEYDKDDWSISFEFIRTLVMLRIKIDDLKNYSIHIKRYIVHDGMKMAIIQFDIYKVNRAVETPVIPIEQVVQAKAENV